MLELNDLEKISDMIDDAVEQRVKHKMSEETKTNFKLMEQKFCTLEEKINDLMKKVKELPHELSMLSDERYADKTDTKLDLERIKGKINFYAWVVPILTGLLGALLMYAIQH